MLTYQSTSAEIVVIAGQYNFSTPYIYKSNFFKQILLRLCRAVFPNHSMTWFAAPLPS